MSDRNHIVAQLGPTNTGKTHRAIERMLELRSGVMGLPLRLLAREVYDRVRARAGDDAVALITGEERIVPRGARYWICTVESMPVHKDVDFVAVDEIQLATHPKRGHVFTDRLLNARGREETWFLGSDTMRDIVRAVAPTAEIVTRARMSQLRYEDPKSVAGLPGRTALVAFSMAHVYELADQVRARHGGAAVVLGALSPRARNAQVELFQSGDVSHLVATDAIGMGLNLDIQHVFFGTVSKFDGRSVRRLYPGELGQVAGRAGRFRKDGQFGLTREAMRRGALPVRVIEAIETQRFEPVRRVFFRNNHLDFESPAALRASLRRKAPYPFMRGSGELADERALDMLLRQQDIYASVVHSPDRLQLLWEVCCVPDYRQAAQGAHLRLLAQLFRQLVGKAERIDAGWVQGRMRNLAQFQGGLDVMMQRVAFNRTWAYIAHRRDWVTQSDRLREDVLALEEQLSSALHERLTQHFVEERTQVRVERPVPHDVALEGDIVITRTVPLGAMRNLSFVGTPEAAVWFGSGMVRRHGRRACLTEAASRAEAFVEADDADITISEDLQIVWEGHGLARLVAGKTPDRPELRLLPLDLLDEKLRARVRARALGWLRGRRDALLGGLEQADVTGALRGIVYLTTTGLGVVPRREAQDLVASLTPAERKRLGKLNIRVGVKWVFARDLLGARGQLFRAAALAVALGQRELPTLPEAAVAPRTSWSSDFSKAYGYPRYGTRCIRVDLVERVAGVLRKSVPKSGVGPLPRDPMNWLGCSPDEWEGIVRAMGYDVSERGVSRRRGRRRGAKKKKGHA